MIEYDMKINGIKINIRKTKVMRINDKKMTKVRTRVEKIEQSRLTDIWGAC